MTAVVSITRRSSWSNIAFDCFLWSISSSIQPVARKRLDNVDGDMRWLAGSIADSSLYVMINEANPGSLCSLNSHLTLEIVK